MTANGQVVQMSPADQVRAKLDDPRVAAALNDLLEHADLLAILVSGLDGLVRRSDEISGNLTSAIGEFKGAANAPLKSVDLAGLADGFAALSQKMVDAMPALNSLLGSGLTDPQGAEVIARLGTAMVEANSANTRNPERPKGFFAILRSAKDPDVARGLGFMLAVAKAFGRQLGTDGARTTRSR